MTAEFKCEKSGICTIGGMMADVVGDEIVTALCGRRDELPEIPELVRQYPDQYRASASSLCAALCVAEEMVEKQEHFQIDGVQTDPLQQAGGVL